MPGGGGMLKLQFDWYIIWVSSKLLSQVQGGSNFSVTTETDVTGQYFPMVLFIVLYKGF